MSKYVRITANITAEFRDAIHQAADLAGVSYTEFISIALQEAMKAQGIHAENRLKSPGGTKGSGSRARIKHP